jgi:hypothetical protein
LSEIPSDIAASAAQAPFQARESANEQSVRRAGQAHAAGRHARAVDESGVIVETGDPDTQVFTDAEGGGSQGRANEDQAQQESATPTPEAGGFTRDETGQLHVDLEA